IGSPLTPLIPDPATATLSRFNDYSPDIADQAHLDSQLEYRFNTGPVQHTTLVGVALKDYQIHDLQSFRFKNPSLNLLNPVYGFALGLPPSTFTSPFLDQTITQKQAAIYAQEQMKIGRLTLVFSGRNDWVDTNRDNRVGPSQNRDDSQFSGRV